MFFPSVSLSSVHQESDKYIYVKLEDFTRVESLLLYSLFSSITILFGIVKGVSFLEKCPHVIEVCKTKCNITYLKEIKIGKIVSIFATNDSDIEIIYADICLW